MGYSRLLLVLLSVAYCRGNGDKFFSQDKFEEKQYDQYSVTNDIWGGNAGHQEMSATNGSKWCAKCSHPSTEGVKSYPHTKFVMNKTAGSYKEIESWFKGHSAVTTGIWSFSYDIWLQKRKYEIMCWMWVLGTNHPIGSAVEQNVKLGNFTWTVWRGSNGQNEVFSFVNINPCWSGTVNIKAILDWLILNMKWIPEGENVIIDEIQHGFELTTTPNDAEFCMDEFSVTAK